MPRKVLTSILIATLIIQLVTSFYYSSEILNQNQLFETQKQKLNDLQDSHQFLKNQFTHMTSLWYFRQQIDVNQYQPVENTIDLNRYP